MGSLMLSEYLNENTMQTKGKTFEKAGKRDDYGEGHQKNHKKIPFELEQVIFHIIR